MSDYDPTNFDGQDEAVAEQELRDREVEAQEIEDFKWLMNGPRGRRIVWGLLEQAGIFRPTFVPGDPTGSAYMEGQRNVGCKLMDLIHGHCVEQYVLMLKERKTNG